MATTELFKALADDVRLDMVRHLATCSEPMPSSQIVGSCSQALRLAQPTLSHHMAKLVQSGVVREQKIGKQKYYQLNVESLQSAGIDPHKL